MPTIASHDCAPTAAAHKGLSCSDSSWHDWDMTRIWLAWRYLEGSSKHFKTPKRTCITCLNQSESGWFCLEIDVFQVWVVDICCNLNQTHVISIYSGGLPSLAWFLPWMDSCRATYLRNVANIVCINLGLTLHHTSDQLSGWNVIIHQPDMRWF